MNEALRDWVANVEDTFYIIGTAAGPHHYPLISLDNHWNLAQFGAGHSCLENVIVRPAPRASGRRRSRRDRSEEHTSELQSLMRNSYAVFCLKKKKTIQK